jgi:flagellar hook-associated protein 1
MSLNAVLSNALSGLAAAQNAMTVTANNVANANTEGYSRQLPQQEAQAIGGRGTGARIAATTRAVDELLTDRLREQQGRAGRSGVLDDVHGKIQDLVFGAPGDADRGIPNRISALAKAAEALAAGPDQPALAAQLVGAAQDFARELADAGAEVQNLRRDLDQGVTAAIAGINGELADLGELNAALGRNGSGPDLLDQRDRILASLAGKLEISVTRGEDDQVALYTRGGVPLLDGLPRQLVYRPAAQVGSATAFGAVRVYRADDLDPATGDPRTGASSAVLVTGGVRAVLTPELAADATADSTQQIVSPLRGGRLQGMLEARDRLLPELADQLGELADAARFTLNAAHDAAVPYPPPSELNGTRTDTAGFAAATRGGTAFLALIDGSTGAVASTFAIDVGGAADTAGLVAQIQAGMGALGSASLNGDGTVRIAAAPGFGLALSEGDSSIVATDDAGHGRSYGLAHYLGLNDLLVRAGVEPTGLQVRGDIAGDARRLSRSRLDVEPGPPMVGRFGGAGDNRGAQALASAFASRVTTVTRGDLPAGSFRLADYAAEIVAVRAGAAERAKSAAANDQALAADLSTRRAELTGVNLDEELSRLVLYQQAYSVSARLISITGQLFDELLAIGK